MRVVDVDVLVYAHRPDTLGQSANRGFARFRDLRWRHPLDE